MTADRQDTAAKSLASFFQGVQAAGRDDTVTCLLAVLKETAERAGMQVQYLYYDTVEGSPAAAAGGREIADCL
jgi:hypothetical protein